MMNRIAVMAAMLMVLFGAGTNAHALTAAGTVIGNQATASYLDAGGTSRTTNSNLVQTTVSQVKSFTLTANGAKAAAPGQTVYYPHTLTNTGNGADTYALNTATTGGGFAHTILGYYIDANGDGVPDNSTLITTTGLVPANTQFKFVVAAVVPTSVTSGTTGTIVVGATDTGSNTDSNTDTTTVANSVINVTKSLSTTSGPSPSSSSITVTLKYTNSGTLPAANLVLTDVLPAGMTYIGNSGRWSVSGTTVLTDGATGDPVGIAYERNAQTVTATIANVDAGISGEVSFQIDIASGLQPTTPGNAAITTNTANYKTETQTAVANTNSVTYTVAQTSSVVANGSATISLDGVPGLEPVTVASAAPGQTIVFNNYVWNNGNGTDSFNVATNGIGSFPSGTAIALFRADGVTPLLDSNGDPAPDTGPLAAGGVFHIVVKATLPSTATAGGPYNVTLTATSINDPSKSDTVLDTLTALTANTVDLTNNASITNGGALGIGAGTGTAITNNTVTPSITTPKQSPFRLYVNNTSTVADSYNLSVTSTVPAGWTVSFAADDGSNTCATTGAALTNTGTLPAGGNRLVCAIVTVPAVNSGNAVPGVRNFEFKVVSALNSAVSDTKVDSVTVDTLNSMSLTPNGAQQTFPGGSVTYTHTLKNNGNVSEDVTFATGFLTDSQAAAGWTSAVYIDSNSSSALDVGTDTLVSTGVPLSVLSNASTTLFVRVFAPGSATALSAADITTLTATYTGGTASATDTTSVTDGLLLRKGQAAVDCTTPGTISYSDAAIPASASTAPGKCIAYQITATNTTAATITNVILSDNIPANTTLQSTCGAPVTTAGTVSVGTGPAKVTATVLSLASTASFQLTFCVMINP